VAKTVGSATTVYFQGVWEQVVGGASKLYYTFNGQVVTMRDTSTNTVTYLHGDHLGSVSLATTSSGALASKQDFDPWGAVRNGRISATPSSAPAARPPCRSHARRQPGCVAAHR
jgi:hypothetical protein